MHLFVPVGSSGLAIVKFPFVPSIAPSAARSVVAVLEFKMYGESPLSNALGSASVFNLFTMVLFWTEIARSIFYKYM